MDLLLVRHGLPVRVEGVDGAADPSLSDAGRRQAEALADWLAAEGVDAIYSSPMRRAHETAVPLAETVGLPITVVDGVAEFDRHADSYVPMEELKAANDPRWQELLDGGYFGDSPQTPEEFQATVVAAIDEIIAVNSGRRVVVSCHGGVINAYLGSVLGIDEVLFFEPAYTGISRVRASSRGHRSIDSINETGHLHPGGHR